MCTHLARVFSLCVLLVGSIMGSSANLVALAVSTRYSPNEAIEASTSCGARARSVVCSSSAGVERIVTALSACTVAWAHARWRESIARSAAGMRTQKRCTEKPSALDAGENHQPCESFRRVDGAARSRDVLRGQRSARERKEVRQRSAQTGRYPLR